MEGCDGVLGVGVQIGHNARFIVFGLVFMKMNIKEQKGTDLLKESITLIPVFETPQRNERNLVYHISEKKI